MTEQEEGGEQEGLPARVNQVIGPNLSQRGNRPEYSKHLKGIADAEVCKKKMTEMGGLMTKS